MDPLRNRLLDIATRHFVERGYDGTSMREIAEACGVSKAALYYHYPSKADLLRDVVANYLDEVAEVVVRGRAAAPGREQLRMIVQGLFALDVGKRAVMRLAMHDMRHLPGGIRGLFAADYRDRFLQPLAQVFQDGMAVGVFRSRDPETTVWLLLGMLYPFFSQGLEADQDAVVDDLLDVLLHGLSG